MGQREEFEFWPMEINTPQNNFILSSTSGPCFLSWTLIYVLDNIPVWEINLIWITGIRNSSWCFWELVVHFAIRIIACRYCPMWCDSRDTHVRPWFESLSHDLWHYSIRLTSVFPKINYIWGEHIEWKPSWNGFTLTSTAFYITPACWEPMGS